MKILFLTSSYLPHRGGVEKHLEKISRVLIEKKHSITIVTEKKETDREQSETKDEAKVIKFSYPHKKIIGLINIWIWLFENRNLITSADIIHCHDVFIWYLPFRFLYPFKKVYTTFHGWEGIYPIPIKNILFKKISSILSTKTIAVGRYIEKYYGIKADKILYGGTDNIKRESNKVKNYAVFLGRLEKDTGLEEFLDWSKIHNDYQIDFIGDGPLNEQCLRYGRVLGFVDPYPFLERAEICVPAGYLSYIEAKSMGCKILTFPNNKLKEDYWKEIIKIKTFPTWNKIANEYLNLYNSKK